MKKQWNKDIRDQLKDFPKKAPEGLLDDIKSEMLRRGLSPTPIAKKPKRLYPMILQRVASVAAVLLILLGLSHLWEKSVTLPVMTEHIEAPLDPIPPLAPLPSSLIAQTEKLVSISLGTLVKEEEESINKEKAEEPQKKNEEKEEEQRRNNDTQETKKKFAKTSPKPKWTYKVSSRKKSSFSFGVYYSAQSELNLNAEKLNADFNTIAPSSPNNNAGNPSETPDNNGGNNSSQPDTTSVLLSRGMRSTYDINNFKGKATHHLPVKFGLSVRYDLNERWSLQSGLTYSYLASDLEETKLEEKYDIKQKLHYIGIPLQIGHQIWESKQFRGYLTAGVQIEKLIIGKAAIQHWKNNLLMDTFTKNVSDKRLQFSALASVGAEYALKKNLSLYIEPGIHYYFKNGNGLQTHYNEQPININLTIGFRLHWDK